MLEKLLTFLADNGIEVPEGTDAAGAMAIVQSLLDAEGGSGETGEETSKEAGEEKATEKMGVA